MAAESSLNSSQSSTCSLLGNYRWREEYLTPTNFILIIVVVSVEAIMIPFTVLLNALVIFLVWRKRYLRKQKPCVLLACLAATDLLVGAAILPADITGHAFRLSGVPVCFVDTVTLMMMYFACGTSMYHLVIISGERYVAIKHALRYETLVTTRRLTAAVVTAWAISVASISSGLVIGLKTHAAVAETIFYALSILGIPGCWTAICFFQVAVFLETRRHRRHIRAHQVSGAAARETLKKDKAARSTAMVVGALLMCYAPTTVSDVVMLTTSLPVDAAYVAFFFAAMSVCTNSLVSPIIYCMRTEEFKRALRELFGRDAPQVNFQATDNPPRVIRRRTSPEAPRPSSGEKQQIAPPELAPVRRFRSHSLDLSLPSEPRNCRKNSV